MRTTSRQEPIRRRRPAARLALALAPVGGAALTALPTPAGAAADGGSVVQYRTSAAGRPPTRANPG